MDSSKTQTPRREFLKTASVLLAASAATTATQAATTDEAKESKEAALPQIQLGKHSVSRLICGANPFNAGSHLSMFLNNEMRAFFTPKRVLQTLRRCEEAGINCWQAASRNLEIYRQFKDEGGKMRLITIEKTTDAIGDLAKAGCIGAAHHGEQTDILFKKGQFDKIHDFLKRVHDAGMLAGISTHMPDVVDLAESKGWEIDYFMTCLYQRNRSKEDLEKLLGQAPLPVGEVYLPQDPPRMFKAIQQTRRPCLAFKILAAGRLAERPASLKQAFRDTLASIRPTDGVIVGIYDRYSNQPAENANFVRQFSAKA